MPGQYTPKRKPEFVAGTDYALIPLSQEQFALVDAADAEWICAWNWSAMWNLNTKSFYAVRKEKCADGKKRLVYLHRAIEGSGSVVVDHRNHRTLDDRKSNLRDANYVSNQVNRRMDKRNRSGYKGVFKVGSRYRCSFRNKNRGTYATPEEANARYLEVAREEFGDFAWDGQDDSPLAKLLTRCSQPVTIRV
jgi:hypothetical protein